MPNISDLRPLAVQPASEAAKLEARARAMQARPSLRETFDAALMQGPVAAVFNAVDTHPLWFDADPSFSLAPEDKLFKELTADLDPVYWPKLAEARSYEHAAYLANIGKNRQKYREQLGAAGMTGTAATIVASVIDPIYLAAGLASGGASVAVGGARVAQLTRAGIVSGAAFGAVEQFKRGQDPAITRGEVGLAAAGGALGTVAGIATAGFSRGVRFAAGGAANAAPTAAYDALTDADRNDVMLNILPQFFLGGVLGALSPATREMDVAIDKAAKKAVRENELDIIQRSGVDLTDEGRAYFRAELEDTFGFIGSIIEADEAAVVQAGIDDARTPANSKGVGFLPPVLAPNQVTRWERVSPDLPRSFEAARADANLARREFARNGEERVISLVQEADGSYGAYVEPARGVARESISDVPGIQRSTFEDQSRDDFYNFIRDNFADARESDIAPSALNLEDRLRLIAQAEEASGTVSHVGPDAIVETDPTVVKAPPPEDGAGGESGSSSGPGFAVGAANPGNPVFAGKRVTKINEQPGDLNLDSVDDTPAAGRRFSIAGMAQRSMSSGIRRLANMLGRDDLNKQGGRPAVFSAREKQLQWHEANEGRRSPAVDDAYRAYVAEETAASRTPMSRAEFNQAAGKTYRNQTSSTNRHIQSVVDLVRKLRKERWELAQRHLVKGVMDRDFDPFVLDRITDRRMLDEAVDRYGPDALIDAVTVAVSRHPENAGMTPKQHRAIAKAYVENAAKQANRWDIEAANRFEYDNAAVFAEELRRADPTLTPDQIDAILFIAKPSNNETNVGSKFRRQNRMDTSYEHTMPDGSTFSVDQLIEHDIEKIDRLNSRFISGRAAASEVYRQFSTTERLIESPQQLYDELAKQARDENIHPDAINADLRLVQAMMKILLGQPMHPGGAFDRPLRILRNVSFARVIGTATGIRNFFEVFGALPEFGMKSVLAQVPELGNTFKNAREGSVSNRLGVELMHIGIGASELTHRTLPTLGDADAPFAPGRLERVENGSRALANATSTVSLVGPVQAWLERTVGRFISQTWLDMALTGELPSEKRLRAMTLEPAMAQRIIDQIKGPNGASYRKTSFGNTLTAFNWQGWTDIGAATAFRQALYKQARRLVFKPDVTQMALWMTTETGKTVTQLRTFAIGAFESKTLFAGQMRDRAAYASFAMQLIAKAASYVGLTYVYAQARDDKREYLRKRLDPATIARAAFSQAEISSIIPIGVDAIQAARGREPYFAFARTTGLGTGPGVTGFLFSNPTADTIDKTLRAAGVPLDKLMGAVEHQFDEAYAFDPRFTQRDAHSVFGGVPWQNMLGVRQLIQQGIKQLPRERQ